MIRPSLAAAAALLLTAACGGPLPTSEKWSLRPSKDATCRNCPDDPGGDGTDTGGGTAGGIGGTGDTGGTTGAGGTTTGGTTGAPPPPPPTPVDGLPQGLTCGLTYYDVTCYLGISRCVESGFATTCNGVVTMDPDGALSFLEGAAPNYLHSFDGDLGNNAVSGFRHQELGLTGIRDLTRSDLFALPAGTACGFHHTSNSPPDYQTLAHTCMGLDPGLGQCPNGWVAKRHTDSGDEPAAFVWCEYQDPHHLCTSSDCVYGALSHGYACGISSNDDVRGFGSCMGSSTPYGCGAGERLGFFDRGRPEGEGVGWCHTN